MSELQLSDRCSVSVRAMSQLWQRVQLRGSKAGRSKSLTGVLILLLVAPVPTFQSKHFDTVTVIVTWFRT